MTQTLILCLLVGVGLALTLAGAWLALGAYLAGRQEQEQATRERLDHYAGREW